MSKKKKKKITMEMIEILVPLPKKWNVGLDEVVGIYKSTCKVFERDYDAQSFMNGFLLGVHIAEDEKVGATFFKRNEEEQA